MKISFFAAGLVSACAVTVVSAQKVDSTRVVRIGEVKVVSTRASEKTPVAYTNVGRDELAGENLGVDMPFLLLVTPSVAATSDAGTGIGYTGLRIRGTDPSRINVTANGVPMNDAESHTVFWVNLPDFASSVANVQVQRGVGTSTNGAGSFGGSVNMRTEDFNADPYCEVATSYGSYNTHKETVRLGTGLMGKWAFDARLSNIGSDGYIDRAGADLDSYYVQAGYYAKNTAVRFINFTGREKTYHAWNGITKKQMDADRRYNPSGEIEDGDGDVVGFYEDQTDNYTQKNFQLLLNQRLADRLSLNATLHYTDGYGYYQEYKNGQELVAYGLTPYETGGETVGTSNLVRRKIMDNRFGGGVFSFDYSSPKLEASLGGALNRYDGDHFGDVIWIKNYVGEIEPDQEYYRNKGLKDDGNVYIKADWAASPKLNLYADVQYRRIHYTMDGSNDKWDENNGRMQQLGLDKRYNFFNPKAGVFYSPDEHHSLYASFAVAHKEPTRNDFKDAKPNAVPKAERLYDYEAGWKYRDRNMAFGVNLYFMDYMNQLVLTGELNDIGEPLARNMPDSYRAGVELTASVRIAGWLRWDGNATFSRNVINDYTEYIDDYVEVEDGDWVYSPAEDHIGNTTIAFSPSFMAGSLFTVSHRGWSGALQSNFVGRQYMNNSSSDEAELKEYFVNNLRLSYTFEPKFMKSITLGAAVNNLLNARYCSNGFAGSYMEGGERQYWAVYFPQATANFLVNLNLKF